MPYPWGNIHIPILQIQREEELSTLIKSLRSGVKHLRDDSSASPESIPTTEGFRNKCKVIHCVWSTGLAGNKVMVTQTSASDTQSIFRTCFHKSSCFSLSSERISVSNMDMNCLISCPMARKTPRWTTRMGWGFLQPSLLPVNPQKWSGAIRFPREPPRGWYEIQWTQPLPIGKALQEREPLPLLVVIGCPSSGSRRNLAFNTKAQKYKFPWWSSG